MENTVPETLVSFINSILEAETQSDLWKSKLFYIPTEQYFSLISGQNQNPDQKSIQQDQKCTINLCQILKFIENYQGNGLSQQEQKVIQKYFGFSQNLTCSKQYFSKKIKPINNKLILSIERQQLVAQTCLKSFFQSIISGYTQIKPHRDNCAKQFSQIFSYFKKQQLHKLSSSGLSKDSLKQFMFEANIYGRINFMYIKQYIFGSNSQQIDWKTLFGLKESMIEFEKIIEVSQENIVSEQVLKEEQEVQSLTENFLYTKNQLTPLESEYCEQKSIILQSVSEINTYPSTQIQAVSVPLPVGTDYSKTLEQISQIQQMLSKTKQKYQKNRQDLENQTKFIKSQQLKMAQNFGKLSYNSSNVNKSQSIKINDIKLEVNVPILYKQASSTQQTPFKQMQKIENTQRNEQKDSSVKMQTPSPYRSHYKTTIIQFNTNNHSKQSQMKPIMTREAMKQQIEQTLQSYKYSSRQNNQSTQRRDAGKIKKRSESKDIQRLISSNANENTLKSTFTSSFVSKGDYNEYESVLKQIKHEQSEYKRMVEQRQKLLYHKETRQKLNFNTQSSVSHNRYSSITSSTQPQLHRQSSQIQYRVPSSTKPSMSQSRYHQIMKEIQTNNLSRSRVSSKKREEIVQKATSQARLRIQQIENRALKRLSKLDEEQSSDLKKTNSYLKLSINPKERDYEMPKYKRTKENPSTVKPHQSPKNLFINDLLNERPTGLRISSNYRQKF